MRIGVRKARVGTIDSKAVPVCKGVYWKRPRAMSEANGYSSLGWFYGFKLDAVVDEQGRFCRFLLASAHVADQEAARCLLAATEAFVVGDANYHGCGVYAQPKPNFKHPQPWTHALAWVRKTVETVFLHWCVAVIWPWFSLIPFARFVRLCVGRSQLITSRGFYSIDPLALGVKM